MFDSLVVQWGTLLGCAALIAVLINILNLAGLVALFLAKVFSPDLYVPGLDQQAAEFANVMTVIVAYISQLLSSKSTHYAIKGVPFFGVPILTWLKPSNRCLRHRPSIFPFTIFQRKTGMKAEPH